MQVIETLLDMQDNTYQAFSKKIILTNYPIIGVQLPKLRKLASSLKNEEWHNYFYSDATYYEELIIKAILVGQLKSSVELAFTYVKYLVPKIDNWAVCDTLCSGLKITNKNRDFVWQFLIPYFKEDEEFKLRFGIVMLLDYYLEDNYIDQVLTIIDNIDSSYYYVRMAIAWTLSVAYIKYPDMIYKYLLNNHLDKWTYNKTIQKIIESYRVSQIDKEKLKKLKR